MRNPERKALVQNKKKREANKEERRQQVKKMMKDVDKRRAGDKLKAVPKYPKNKKETPKAPIFSDTVPAKPRRKKKKPNNSGNMSRRQFQGIYNS